MDWIQTGNPGGWVGGDGLYFQEKKSDQWPCSLHGISELLYIHPKTDHILEKQEISAE